MTIHERQGGLPLNLSCHRQVQYKEPRLHVIKSRTSRHYSESQDQNNSGNIQSNPTEESSNIQRKLYNICYASGTPPASGLREIHIQGKVYNVCYASGTPPALGKFTFTLRSSSFPHLHGQCQIKVKSMDG